MFYSSPFSGTNTTGVFNGPTHKRDSSHDRYSPRRWSHTSYLGVPGYPSRHEGEHRQRWGNFFSILSPFLPLPPHTRVSAPLRLPSHLQLLVPANNPVTLPSRFPSLMFSPSSRGNNPVNAPQRVPFFNILSLVPL